ncbi:hypothetical protein [Caldibacillus debilis]|uniref:hypothetical protein n=1 Tax=Caldibacillus debilis TaxID=301148 RepID=UPI0023F50F0B|nr:hypothetical protein [Caldibacillus debilis]
MGVGRSGVGQSNRGHKTNVSRSRQGRKIIAHVFAEFNRGTGRSPPGLLFFHRERGRAGRILSKKICSIGHFLKKGLRRIEKSQNFPQKRKNLPEGGEVMGFLSVLLPRHFFLIWRHDKKEGRCGVD